MRLLVLILCTLLCVHLSIQVPKYIVEETTIGGNNREHNIENIHEEEDSYGEEEEEEEVKHVVEETDFKFTDFVHRFANVKVVKACALLLQQFDKNSAQVNHCTAKLLHRIAWECKTPAMIFQASIFRSFEKILDSKRPEDKELAKFAVFMIRQFAEVAQKNPKAYMELLFWKTTREATEMVEGYDTLPISKKAASAMWTEAEEDELRTLFMEHQTNKYPQDVVDWILENIINDNRTRRGVIKKMKEMFLIVNSKAVRNEVQKRLPKEWSEEEVSQLAEIWEQVKEDDDPVDLIYTGLRIKRPKPKIKEKLLELGLAEDRKQLRKKRRRRSGPGKSTGQEQSGSDSDSDEDCDEEKGTSSVQTKPSKRRTKPETNKQPTIVYTNAQLSGLLKDVIDRKMSESLEWLKESLEDVLDDWDEESTEGVPLVPITVYANAAMDSPSFQRLLRALGIAPPASEQEAYWRIPSNMLIATIRKRCELIAQALAGEFVVEEIANDPGPGLDVDEDSEDDGDVFENVKKFFATKPAEAESGEASTSQTPFKSGSSRSKILTIRSDSESDEEVQRKVARIVRNPSPIESVTTKLKKSRLRTIAVSSDSEKEDEMQENGTNDKMPKEAAAESVTKLNKSRLRTIAISSDSENEDELQEDTIDDKLLEEATAEIGKRNRSENSDAETPVIKKRRVLDSDEEDSAREENSETKQPRVLVSDDED